MESRKFEDSFQDAFKEAEVSPTENVWTNIELDLEKAEGDKMKRRVFFYKLLAAASVAFAMCVAGIGYYVVQNEHQNNGQFALNQTPALEDRGKSNTTNGNNGTEEGNATEERNDSALSGNESSSQDQSDSKGISVEPDNAFDGNSASSSSSVSQERNSNASENDQQSVAGLSPKQRGDKSNKNNAASPGEISPAVADEASTSEKYTQKNTIADAAIDSKNAKQNNATNERLRDASTLDKATKSDGYTSKKNDPNTAIASDKTNQNNTANEKTIASADKVNEANNIAVNDSQYIAKNSANGNNAVVDAQGKNQTSTSTDKQGSIALVNKNEVNNANGINKAGDNTSQQTLANNTATPANDKNAIADTQNKNASSLTEDRQPVASSESANNTSGAIDINPFTRYGNTSGEFGAISKSTSVASNASVNKLPARMNKPADFDATKLAPQEDPLMVMLARLDQQEKNVLEEQKKEEKNNTEKLWTSVGFAAGSFNTVNSTVSPSSAQSFAANSAATQQAKASGSAYTVGISLGTRISKRWVVQGGVNYMTQASDYTANAVGTSDFTNFSAPNVNSMMSEADSKIVSTAPYTINNNVQFVSIPLQAGYLVVNKRFGVQLNGGISTDMFLQNTLTPESDNVSKTTQGSGADSPYRSLNFSGLVGTEFSYKFGQHYRLSLNPGLRYPFNSIYKSDQPITAMPLTFDVGLRFRYIFH
ncbi:outer membrane beta-barrel protein [Ohtaekwangia koreensis]|uniref:Outer membrane protein beta-barrel domain-containing protein n=1 Tax=Ohtaekwangia koreensis TaxID=688867 RepID=A0A1T5K7H0_9BACT|nr:outer membrane beta-barrel protein [Ohtaekwangia koreensis]SKC59613.1 Outer membrane protein beta-barrel domain-containing protein [Ohtaekwangia koreensis]